VLNSYLFNEESDIPDEGRFGLCRIRGACHGV
jgi:hypothetical protein